MEECDDETRERRRSVAEALIARRIKAFADGKETRFLGNKLEVETSARLLASTRRPNKINERLLAASK